MARIGTPLKLSDEDFKELTIMSRSNKLDYRYVIRSRIILKLYEGKNYDQVQKELSVGRAAVAKWKSRFLKDGIEGLKDMAGRGKKPIYKPDDKARIVQKACEKPAGGYTNWSQRRIAKELGMSQSTVQKTLKEHTLKPHKVEYWCGKSTDPEFEEKMLNVVGLYMSPPQNSLVISVDEKTSIQAPDRSQPELPLRVGNPKRLTATYKRNGTVSLIAALSVHSGEITAETIDKNNHKNFLKFLKKLYRKYPKKHLHIIADNLNVHKHHKVKEWVSTKKRVTLHFTPTYSSWLNQIEIWFNILTKDVLKGGVWHSKQQLIDQLLEYIETYNKTRTVPFQWTYDPNSSAFKKSLHYVPLCQCYFPFYRCVHGIAVYGNPYINGYCSVYYFVFLNKKGNSKGASRSHTNVLLMVFKSF